MVNIQLNLDMLIGISSSSRQGLAHRGWRKLWQLEIPQKARVFLWRVCNNNVPTRNLLRGRGVTTTILCPMCGVDVEHLLHIFLDCEFTKACWRRMGWEFNALGIYDLSEWLLHCLATESKEKSVQIATVLWGFWRARNLKVWEGNVISPEIVMQMSCLQVSQWQDALKVKNSSLNKSVSNSNQSETKWAPPGVNQVKINVDAAVQPGSSMFKIGMVLRDQFGGFKGARMHCFGGAVSVFETEAQGIYQALL